MDLLLFCVLQFCVPDGVLVSAKASSKEQNTLAMAFATLFAHSLSSAPTPP